MQNAKRKMKNGVLRHHPFSCARPLSRLGKYRRDCDL
jgi:hypothetical protein